jgi:hypothetical protein
VVGSTAGKVAWRAKGYLRIVLEQRQTTQSLVAEATMSLNGRLVFLKRQRIDNLNSISVFVSRADSYIRFRGDERMAKARWLFRFLCTIVLSSGMTGCHRSGNASTSEGAEGEFVQAFLTAHDNKDLDAEEKLVNWDNVTENSRNHFIGELKSGLDVKITAQVEEMPAVPAGFSARYNIPPEKFLTVVYHYDDARGAITVKFPIARKEGRYCFALRKE